MSSDPEKQIAQAFVEQADAQDLEVMGHAANYEEHAETASQAIKRHPKALAWCAYALWVLTLSSYDNTAGGVFLAIPAFREHFGFPYHGGYVLPAKWQSAYSGAPTATAVIGALGSSYLADKIGRRLVYLMAFIFMLVGVTLETIAVTNAVFFGGKFVNGFAVGAFGTITVTYLGEIAPQALRGAMTAAAGLSFTFGPFMVTLILNAYGNMNSRWAYRGIFVSQYAVTVIGLIGLPFMPESPWWLVAHGQEEKAARALSRLDQTGTDINRRIAAMKLTLEKVRQETEGVTFAECFRKSNLRRTIVGIMPLSIQALTGISFVIAYGTYYIQLAGLGAQQSFKVSVGQTVLAMVGNIISWFLVDPIGRRNLTLYGMVLITVCLLLCGGLGTQTASISCVKGVVAFLTLYVFVYNCTLGATAYNLLAEVATSRLRAKTVSIGLALQSCLYTMWSFILPYLFNPNEANLGAKTTFIFAGLSILSLVYLWFYQPETRGRSYEELDEMFAKHIPAREFKTYRTEVEISREAAVAELK